jgi:hypothetical protein
METVFTLTFFLFSSELEEEPEAAPSGVTMERIHARSENSLSSVKKEHESAGESCWLGRVLLCAFAS